MIANHNWACRVSNPCLHKDVFNFMEGKMKPDEYLVKIQFTDGVLRELNMSASSRDSAIFKAGAWLADHEDTYFFSHVISCDKINS